MEEVINKWELILKKDVGKPISYSLDVLIEMFIDFRHAAKSKTLHKCPICDGRGIVPGGFYTSTTVISMAGEVSEPCKQCNGTGIIHT